MRQKPVGEPAATATGVVCPGDGALTTTSVLAATGGLDHPSIASYNRHGLREKVIGQISQKRGS